MNKVDYVATNGTPDSEHMFGDLQDNSVEEVLIANSMLRALTAESKFVLYAIFNTPGELSKMLLGGRPGVENVRKYLKCMGWKQRHINNTLTELKRFTKEIFV